MSNKKIQISSLKLVNNNKNLPSSREQFHICNRNQQRIRIHIKRDVPYSNNILLLIGMRAEILSKLLQLHVDNRNSKVIAGILREQKETMALKKCSVHQAKSA